MIQRRVFLLGSALALGGMVANAQTARFIALRYWTSPEYTRLALEFDGVLLIDERNEPVASNLAINSARTYELELLGLAFIPALLSQLTQTYQNPLLAGIKAYPMTNGLRLGLELKQDVRVEIATVPASSSYRQRLLIDLYPTTIDPIENWLLLQKRATQNEAKNSSVNVGVNATKKSTKTLVIDAGHGGEDPGAIGPTGVKEKDVTLALALQLANSFKQSSSWRVILTREADYFVPLAVRVKKARAARADLFVSIHADAFLNPKARGASVYALSEKGASSAAAKWMASRENEADSVGGLNISHRDKQVANVMLDLSSASQIRSSIQFGGILLKQLGQLGTLHKKQVEQASFAVLKAPDVPSILVETAFISHPVEEQLLINADYQARLVGALGRAINRYRSS